MDIHRDGLGQPYIEWAQAPGSFKRAWIQRKSNPDKDWAEVSRYLNVVRCNSPGHPGGNPTDWPIYFDESDMPDEQILRAFVYATATITGGKIPG